MGTKERRARERLQQRQKILDAALTIISESGFAALSMRRLAEQIEYSAASIYLHFETRNQIAQELRHFGFEQLLAKLKTSVKDLLGRKALHAIGDAYVSFGIEQPQLYRLMFMGEPGTMQIAYAEVASDALADRTYQLLLGVVEGLKGVAEEKASSTEIADVVWSCLHGMVSLHLALPGFQMTHLPVHQALSLALLAKGLQQALDDKPPTKQGRS